MSRVPHLRPRLHSHLRSRLRQALVWACVAVVLGAVFMAYARPQLAMELAELVWSCF